MVVRVKYPDLGFYDWQTHNIMASSIFYSVTGGDVCVNMEAQSFCQRKIPVPRLNGQRFESTSTEASHSSLQNRSV